MTMTTTTKTFLIIARASGQNMGLFEAATEDDAVLAMIRAAGYRDAAHEAEVLQSTPEKLRAELSVFEIDVPAIVAKLADAMVEQDLTPDQETQLWMYLVSAAFAMQNVPDDPYGQPLPTETTR